MKKIADTRFAKNNGILLIAVIILIAWTALVWCVSGAVKGKKVTEKLTAEYDTIYEQRMQSFTEEIVALNTPTKDEEFERQLHKEADEIARAIGTMNSKRQKLSMLWNILMRVDSPYYPNTVTEVVNQPKQWMFYDSKNPVCDDDVNVLVDTIKEAFILIYDCTNN